METKNKIPRNVIIVAFVALASGFGQDMITPILPAFLLTIGIDRAGIGLIDGLLQGVTNVFRFVSGVLSDRFANRKRFVFFGYFLSSVARPLLALTSTFGSIALLRAVDGVGKGTKDAPRDALIADSAPSAGRGRAFGFQRFIDTAGSVLGPLTAGAFLLMLMPTLATYRLIFALATIPGAIALGLILFGIREPAAVRRPKVEKQWSFPWQFWMFSFGIAVAMLTKVNDSLFLVRAEDLGIAKEWIPILFAGFTFVYAVLSYPIGIWSDRVGKLPLIAAGWLLLSLVELGFAHTSSIESALILFSLYGLFYALTEGSGRAFIADLVRPESRGSAYAIYYTVTGVAVVIGGYGLGRLWDQVSPQFAFTVSAVGSVIGFIILLFVVKIRRPRAITA